METLLTNFDKHMLQGTPFVKLYNRKDTLAAAYLINKLQVTAFIRISKILLLRILTDRGTKYFGNRKHHEYQLLSNL